MASNLQGDIEAAYQAYADAIVQANTFSWVNHLLVPGIQAAATLGLLKYQDSQIDEANDKRVKLVEFAVKHWTDCIDKMIGRVEDAIDDVPEPAMYQPVSPSGEQLETIADNDEALRYTQEYAERSNEYRVALDLAREALLNPSAEALRTLAWTQIGDLINGKISVSKVLRITTDDAEAAVINGRIGTTCAITRVHLGVEQENAQASGRAEQRLERASMNRDVSDISRQFNLEEWMLKPDFRIGAALQQAELIQNAAQNAYNACAKKPPFLLQKIFLEIEKCKATLQAEVSKAGMIDSFVPNYAGVLQDSIGQLSRGVGGLFGGGVNTFAGNPTASLSHLNFATALGHGE